MRYSEQKYFVQWQKCVPKNGGGVNSPGGIRNPGFEDLGREADLNGRE